MVKLLIKRQQQSIVYQNRRSTMVIGV